MLIYNYLLTRKKDDPFYNEEIFFSFFQEFIQLILIFSVLLKNYFIVILISMITMISLTTKLIQFHYY